ncbi:MAG: CPBP family intramembrane glutamic endopeptidase [Erythrobacter sp.]|nr:CPBP family intramembrane glutamic endopeptidase [Erythrobacter sp.]
MTIMPRPVRECERRKLAAIILAASLAVAAANYFAFAREDSLVWDLHRASDGWINANLTIFVPMTLVIVGGLVMGWAGQRVSDLGLLPGWPLRLVLLLGGGWALMQLIAAGAALASGTGLALHPAWSEHGAGTVLGLLIAMVLGTALFEDALFRGFVLPQLVFALGSRFAAASARTIAALLACAVIFALWHLPTILLNREVTAGAVAGALAYMALGGVLLGLVYLRTARLEVAIACHALVNAPTMLIASPLSGSLVAGIVGVGAIIAGPVLAGERWSAGLVRFEPR